MSKLEKILITIALLVMSGCGIRFTHTQLRENQVLPPAVTNSIPATIYRHNLNALTGQIAVVDANGVTTPVLRAVDPSQLPVIRSISEANGVLYKSIISQEYSGTLRAVSSGVDLTGNQKAELVIIQIAESTLQEVPRDQVLEKAVLITTTQANQKLVYITGAVLSLVRTQLFDNIGSNATVTYGPIFGFNGEVYQASSQVRNDYIITLSTVDVDHLRDTSLTRVNTTNDTAKTLTAPAPTSPQLPQISGSELPSPPPPQPTAVNAPTLEKPEQPPSPIVSPAQVDVSPTQRR
jgi:hypothetical protein